MLVNFASEAALARDLLRTNRSAALATLDSSGGPFTSYVVTAPADDGAPLFLLSNLAAHTRHLLRDPRASLLLVREPEAGEEAMTAIRLSISGRVLADENPQSRALFLAGNPDAARYADFQDFAIYRFHIESGHLVAGFGRIVDFAAADLATPAEAAE